MAHLTWAIQRCKHVLVVLDGPGKPGHDAMMSERLRQPEEEAAPRPELRRADADAGAVADLIDFVEQR